MSFYDNELNFEYMYSGERPYLVTAIQRPARRIQCAGCDEFRFIVGGGVEIVRSQMRLWHEGWRRVPEIGLDYCPDCVPTVV